MWNQLIVDYLTQLGDIVEESLKRYKNRLDSPCTFHANDTLEDLMVIHNRINRVLARASYGDEPEGEQPVS